MSPTNAISSKTSLPVMPDAVRISDAKPFKIAKANVKPADKLQVMRQNSEAQQDEKDDVTSFDIQDEDLDLDDIELVRADPDDELEEFFITLKCAELPLSLTQ